MLSRKERVKLIWVQIEKEWHDKWWSFMMEYEDRLSWNWLSRNPNIAMDIIKDKEQLKKYKNIYREVISCGLKLITLPYEGLEVTQKLVKPTYNYKEMIKFLHQYGITLTGNMVEAFERYE